MNEIKSYVYPSIENPQLISVLTVWHEDGLFKAESFTSIYLPSTKVTIKERQLSSLRDTYFSNEYMLQAMVSDSDALRTQFSVLLEGLRSDIRRNAHILTIESGEIEPVPVENELLVRNFSATLLFREIAERSRNSKLRDSIRTRQKS